MSLKPIKIFSHKGAPNPWKVVLLCSLLSIPTESEYPDFNHLHEPEYEQWNPNGRLPAIVDPNNNSFVLWESGAILEYLLEKYDTNNLLTFAGDDAYLAKQFLHFQMSGQGPYFGQAYWFSYYHHETFPSAVERYVNEAKRVMAVLDKLLEGKEWLVGGKFSYVEVAWLPWFWAYSLDANKTGIKDMYEKGKVENPNFGAWIDRINALPGVKKVWGEYLESRGVTKKD